MGKESEKYSSKKKKSKKLKKHRKRNPSTSSSSESSGNEWVEKNESGGNKQPNSETSTSVTTQSSNIQRDEWMSVTSIIPCVTRKQLRADKEPTKKQLEEIEKKKMLDEPGQTNRELNPYWANGGTGLPPEAPGKSADSASSSGSSAPLGNSDWYKRALRRAKEQAEEDGRSLEEVAAERWGSLDKLLSLIDQAEKKNLSNFHVEGRTRYDDKRFNRNEKRHDRNENNYDRRHDRDNKRFDAEAIRRNRDDRLYDSDKKRSPQRFRKPDLDDEDRNSPHSSRSSNMDADGRRSPARFRKPELDEKDKRDSRRFRKPDSDDEDKKDSRRFRKPDSDDEDKRDSRRFRKPDSDDEDKKDSRRFRKPDLDDEDKKDSRRFRKPDSDDEDKRDSRRYRKPDSDDEDRRDSRRFRKPEQYDRRSPPQRFRKPNLDDPDRRDRRSYHDTEDIAAPSKPRFQKPSDSDEPRMSTSYGNRPSGSGSWRKKDPTKVESKPRIVEEDRMKSPSPSSSPSSSSDSESDTEKKEETPVLTETQLNELAAKLVKAEILGNDSLANELKEKLQSARETRKAKPAAAAAADKGGKEEIVILSRTDSKGFSRPLQTKGAHAEPYGGRRRKQKVDTHAADGQRARYFPDDDKYSLQEMFQREKTTTVEDDREMFARLAGKDKRQEHDLDMDDIFSERARESVSDGKLEAKERDRAIWEHKRMSKVLDDCQWCFDNKSSLKHLVIAIGSVSYVCLPSHQSLTEGHCLVAPIRHVPCATQLDEDVWQEMQDFRRALVKMFSDRGDDCIWFESAMHLNRQPHMVWNCVPLPRESGDVAPIYFKKAILECETEWSTNKKLVDLGGRDVRKAVPKGLPYFAVDFGMQSGFAHVIEDEKMFPGNFAQEIIGGMLELDHFLWRKPRRESFEVLTKKVNAFIKEWAPYDITKKGKKRKKSKKEKRQRSRSGSSSSSSSDSD